MCPISSGCAEHVFSAHYSPIVSVAEIFARPIDDVRKASVPGVLFKTLDPETGLKFFVSSREETLN